MPVDLKNYFKFSPYYANNENLSKKELAELDEKADNLPMEVKDHLLSVDTSKIIQKLINSHNLTEKQAVIVAVLIRRIFLKSSSKNTLAADLVKYANIDATKARQITELLEQNIFLTVPTPITKTTPQYGKENVINLKQK